jgi:hypothetical protein
MSLAVGVLSTRAVHAQNSDRFYLAGDAAMQGGAITADVRGGGAIWYNPAALARLPNLRLDVSMSAYAIGFGGQPDFDPATPGSTVTRLTTLDLRSVPAGMSLTHKMGKVGLGFGLFVPTQTSSYLRTRVQTPATSTAPIVDAGVDVTSLESEYFGGPSIGVALSSTVDIGLSLLGHYRSQFEVSALALNVGSDPASGAALLSHTTYDWVQLGLQPVLGVQLRPLPTWNVGITLRFPSFRLYQILHTVTLQNAFVAGFPAHELDFQDVSGFAASIVKPPRIHLGVSHDIGPNRIAIEFSYQSPLRNKEVNQDLRGLVNARVGARRRVAKRLAVGGGLFSNRSASAAPKEFGDTQIDYYGVTLAAELGTPYEVSKRGEKVLFPYGKLNFGATLGLTYSIGVGSIMRGQIGSSEEGIALLSLSPASVVAHEIMLSLGSSLEE